MTNSSYRVSFLPNFNPFKLEDYPMQAYEDLKTLVVEIEADINKAEGGNKAAGTRVRKQMQDVKKTAQAVRNTVLELRTT